MSEVQATTYHATTHCQYQQAYAGIPSPCSLRRNSLRGGGLYSASDVSPTPCITHETWLAVIVFGGGPVELAVADWVGACPNVNSSLLACPSPFSQDMSPSGFRRNLTQTSPSCSS